MYLLGAETKERIAANLANFAYDPYNYNFLRQVSLLEMIGGKYELYCFCPDLVCTNLCLILTAQCFGTFPRLHDRIK